MQDAEVCCVSRIPCLQIAAPVLSGIPVGDVAKAMILDAEAFRNKAASGGSSVTFSDAACRKSAASGQPPQE